MIRITTAAVRKIKIHVVIAKEVYKGLEVHRVLKVCQAVTEGMAETV